MYRKLQMFADVQKATKMSVEMKFQERAKGVRRRCRSLVDALGFSVFTLISSHPPSSPIRRALWETNGSLLNGFQFG